MYKFQYKEHDYALEILKNGFTSNRIKSELKILVKYYKEQGMKPKQRKEAIIKFCEDNLDGYKHVLHFKMINSVLNYGSNKNNKLIQINSIGITESELNYIDQLEIECDYKKILFTLLALDKLKKKYHGIRNEQTNDEYYFSGAINYRSLGTSSKVKLKNKDHIHMIIGELANKGLIEIINRGTIKLSFIYEIPKRDKTVIDVSDFESIGYYYDLHIGDNKVKKCERCEKIIKIINNSNKFCTTCAKLVWKEYNAAKQREYRKMKRV